MMEKEMNLIAMQRISTTKETKVRENRYLRLLMCRQFGEPFKKLYPLGFAVFGAFRSHQLPNPGPFTVQRPFAVRNQGNVDRFRPFVQKRLNKLNLLFHSLSLLGIPQCDPNDKSTPSFRPEICPFDQWRQRARRSRSS